MTKAGGILETAFTSYLWFLFVLFSCFMNWISNLTGQKAVSPKSPSWPECNLGTCALMLKSVCAFCGSRSSTSLCGRRSHVLPFQLKKEHVPWRGVSSGQETSILRESASYPVQVKQNHGERGWTRLKSAESSCLLCSALVSSICLCCWGGSLQGLMGLSAEQCCRDLVLTWGSFQLQRAVYCHSKRKKEKKNFFKIITVCISF